MELLLHFLPLASVLYQQKQIFPSPFLIFFLSSCSFPTSSLPVRPALTTLMHSSPYLPFLLSLCHISSPSLFFLSPASVSSSLYHLQFSLSLYLLLFLLLARNDPIQMLKLCPDAAPVRDPQTLSLGRILFDIST